MAKYNYLFERDAAERKKKRSEAARKGWETRRRKAERKKKRSEAARKGWETRRQKSQVAPLTPAERKIKERIRYLNKRLRQYGDPDHMIALLPDEIKTDSGYLSVRPESVEFFTTNPELLNQIQSTIRKHPVSNAVRDAFEEMLHNIYDQITEIGQERFFEIVGKDFQRQLGADADTNRKMQEMVERWEKEKAAIPAYYEEQIRKGKLTPFTD